MGLHGQPGRHILRRNAAQAGNIPRAYIYELNRREDFTAFPATHYGDETKNRDRDDDTAAIGMTAIDTAAIDTAAIDTAAIDTAAIDTAAGTFRLEAAGHTGAVTSPVAAGKQFVPRLRAEFPGTYQVGKCFSFHTGRRLQVLYRQYRPRRQGVADVPERGLGHDLRPVSIWRRPRNAPGVSVKTFICPACWRCRCCSQPFLAAPIGWDPQTGFLREILGAPVSRASIVIGTWQGGATITSGLPDRVRRAEVGQHQAVPGLHGAHADAGKCRCSSFPERCNRRAGCPRG
jgi:hypothetical protein